MALKSVQLVLSTTEQAVLVQGSGAGQFLNIAGSLADPLPVRIANTDATITMFVGGPGVTSATGTPLLAGQALSLSLYGTGEIPHIVAASGTPTAAILCGRQ